MTVQNIFNLIGLFIGMVGSYLMYANSSKVQSGTYIYTNAELIEMQRKDRRKNTLIRRGMLMIFVAFLLQCIALLLPNSST